MAYSDFTLPRLTHQFSLSIDERQDLFSQIPEVALRPEFKAQLAKTVPLALALSTEKARSELIISPVLVEVWQMTNQEIGLFSGVDFSVDTANGLAGVCDFILTRSQQQLFVKAPVVMLVEAKNEDMKRGYAQCAAEMIAARQFNMQEKTESEPIYGVVTIGDNWKFLTLEGSVLN